MNNPPKESSTLDLRNAPVMTVAPSPRLAAELDRVAASAEDLIFEITKTNFEIDDQFPKQTLVGIAESLTNLSAGSKEGALHALEYATGALNQFRFSTMEIADGDIMPDFARGGRLDQALGKLISDVTTAKQFYSQSRLDAVGKSEFPDRATATVSAGQRDIAKMAQDVSDEGLALADRLGRSAAELSKKHDAHDMVAENLSRETRDIANLARQERIELESGKPRIAWLAKLHRGAQITLGTIELTSGVAEITLGKISDVLTADFREWFDSFRRWFASARGWAKETQTLIDELATRWLEENKASTISKPGSFSYPRGFDANQRMTIIPAGAFLMGSRHDEGKHDERPQRSVIIENPLEVGITPVTRGEFSAFVKAAGYKIDKGANVWTGRRWNYDPSKSWLEPGFDQADDHPVVCVSWDDAKAYVAWLTEQSGVRSYRLLSEAEWEYCCRAGTRTLYSTGETITTDQANFANLVHGTTPVWRFRPNPWGLHDMHGNVWELCEDDWHDDYSGNAPATGSVWESGDGTRRVERGGSWFDSLEDLRSAKRNSERPNSRFSSVGFRIAREV